MSRLLKGDEILLKEFQLKCRIIEDEKVKMLAVKQNLQLLNDKNEIISKRLSNIKNGFEYYKSNLKATLFNQKLATDKQKILSEKKLDEFSERISRTKEYCKVSPIRFELEELIKNNLSLQEECKKKAYLLELTKQQHKELMNIVLEMFEKKVCEFCQIILQHNLIF